MTTRKLPRFLFLAGFLGLLPANSGSGQLSPETFASLKELISPSKDEQDWLGIPWQTDLAEARAQAARDGKPVFLWEMDGHPLGCT